MSERIEHFIPTKIGESTVAVQIGGGLMGDKLSLTKHLSVPVSVTPHIELLKSFLTMENSA